MSNLNNIQKEISATLKGAIIDSSGQYRYSLWRIWNFSRKIGQPRFEWLKIKRSIV
jgi:hypothetical protein